MGAVYLNWGAGSTDMGVLRSGLAEGALSFWCQISFFSAQGASLAELVLKSGGLGDFLTKSISF